MAAAVLCLRGSELEIFFGEISRIVISCVVPLYLFRLLPIVCGIRDWLGLRAEFLNDKQCLTVCQESVLGKVEVSSSYGGVKMVPIR